MLQRSTEKEPSFSIKIEEKKKKLDKVEDKFPSRKEEFCQSSDTCIFYFIKYLAWNQMCWVCVITSMFGGGWVRWNAPHNSLVWALMETEYSELLGWSQFPQFPPAMHRHLVLNKSHHLEEKQVLGGIKEVKKANYGSAKSWRNWWSCVCWNWYFILEETQTVPGQGSVPDLHSSEEMELRLGGSSCWLGPSAEYHKCFYISYHKALAPEGMGLQENFFSH